MNVNVINKYSICRLEVDKCCGLIKEGEAGVEGSIVNRAVRTGLAVKVAFEHRLRSPANVWRRAFQAGRTATAKG